MSPQLDFCILGTATELLALRTSPELIFFYSRDVPTIYFFHFGDATLTLTLSSRALETSLELIFLTLGTSPKLFFLHIGDGNFVVFDVHSWSKFL